MTELDPAVREKTDALDAAGNTTAAIGKGFAIGSAAVVSLALFGAFVTRIRNASGDTLFSNGVNMLEPLTFAFLIIGGMIPFAFAAMTMKSVGVAAMEMVLEVQRQFDEKPSLLDENSTERPDYDACIGISTKASLKEMVPPAILVIFTPLITGLFFGVNAVSGLLVGSLVASVQLAISMSNSGGAWDNAKKYIEKQPADSELKGKGSDIHKAAVVGDTHEVDGRPFARLRRHLLCHQQWKWSPQPELRASLPFPVLHEYTLHTSQHIIKTKVHRDIALKNKRNGIKYSADKYCECSYLYI
jgi:inorganic pyrophosphatase